MLVAQCVTLFLDFWSIFSVNLKSYVECRACKCVPHESHSQVTQCDHALAIPRHDPYLKHPELWPNVHNRLIAAIADAVALLIAPR